MVLTILIPYFLWSLIYCNFNFKNVGWIIYGSWIALGKAQTLTSMWYLICLFCARIFVQLLIALVSRTGRGEVRMIYLIPAAVCLMIGALLPDLENGYPWCINVAVVAAACILLGIALRNGIIQLSVQKGWVLCLSLAASIVLFAMIVRALGDNYVVMMMCAGRYGNPIFALVLAVLGGFAVMALSMILKRLADEWIPNVDLKHVIYLGQHTMGVFLLHKPMLQELIGPAVKSILPNGPDILVRLLATVAAVIISTYLCRLIEYYIPELVGIFSKDIITGKEKA